MNIFYGRSSTGRNELSLDLQLNEVETKFGKMDKVYFDNISGVTPIEKREALLEMLETIKKGDTIFIYSLSRIARETLTALVIEKEIIRAGAKIESVKEDFGDSSEQVLLRTILAAVAQYELSLIRGRVKAAKAIARKKGNYCGGKREYGYDVVEGKLVENAKEQETLKLMKDWYAAGDKMTTITDRLNASGIESATGNNWNYYSVRRVIQRKVA